MRTYGLMQNKFRDAKNTLVTLMCVPTFNISIETLMHDRRGVYFLVSHRSMFFVNIQFANRMIDKCRLSKSNDH